MFPQVTDEEPGAPHRPSRSATAEIRPAPSANRSKALSVLPTRLSSFLEMRTFSGVVIELGSRGGHFHPSRGIRRIWQVSFCSHYEPPYAHRWVLHRRLDQNPGAGACFLLPASLSRRSAHTRPRGRYDGERGLHSTKIEMF